MERLPGRAADHRPVPFGRLHAEHDQLEPLREPARADPRVRDRAEPREVVLEPRPPHLGLRAARRRHLLGRHADDGRRRGLQPEPPPHGSDELLALSLPQRRLDREDGGAPGHDPSERARLPAQQELANFAGVVVQQEFAEEAGEGFGSPETGVMCTGPFRFEKWTQGQSITVARYDDYWNQELQPKAKQIEFTFLTDDAAITSGLQSGQIDGTFGVPVSGVAQLNASGVGNYYVGPAPLETTLVVANPDGPMGNADARKALHLAIDWKGIGEQVYGGLGTPSALQTPPAAYGFATEQLTAYADTVATDGTPQIEAAKKLVDALPADVKSDAISLVVPQQSETQQLGVAIKDAADRIGLNFELEVVPATGYSNYLYDPATRGDTDLLYTQFWAGVPNPLDWISATAVTAGIFNQSGYDGIDELYYEAVATEDEAERAELVVQMEQQLYEEMGPMFPGVRLDNDVFMNKRITGAPASFSYVWYPWAAHLGSAE
nr:ABC transporter substrate-binding protein [Agromyces cavernae]